MQTTFEFSIPLQYVLKKKNKIIIIDELGQTIICPENL